MARRRGEAEELAGRMAPLLGARLREAGQDGEGPITVAELHRRLLPYPLCRERLGLATKAEYDLGILGLLAHGGTLRVEEEALRAAVGRELDSPEPGLAVLSRFSASEVRVGERPRGEGPGSAGATTHDAAAGEDAAGAKGDSAADGPPRAALEREFETRRAPRGLSSPDEVPGDPERAGPPAGPPAPRGRARGSVAAPAGRERPVAEGADPCAACRRPLPDREGLRYCPYCGEDQWTRPCPACGADVEREWRFCAACGTPVTAD